MSLRTASIALRGLAFGSRACEAQRVLELVMANRTLAASARYPLASYAGEQWPVLLWYLEGKGNVGPRP